MTETPNLFKHATSELSQDAFIAWLLEWSHPNLKTVDESMHKLGTSFLESLLATKNIAINSIESLKVKTQYHKIDVFVDLVMNNERIGIIIEDKVYSSNHSNQLVRYKEIISKEVDKVVPIYFKTGFQHCNIDVINKDYHPYTVKEFSALLRKGLEQGIENDVIINYYKFITEREVQFDNAKYSLENYKSQPIGEWDWWSCTGFFEEYKKQFKAGSGSVGNNRQPLLAFWFGERYLSIKDENNKTITFKPYIDVLYSQRHIKINYRIAVNENPQTTNRNRNIVYSAFKPYLDNAGIKHKKPTFRKAKETMLLAQVTDLNMDMKYDELVTLLTKYKTVLDSFINQQACLWLNVEGT